CMSVHSTPPPQDKYHDTVKNTPLNDAENTAAKNLEYLPGLGPSGDQPADQPAIPADDQPNDERLNHDALLIMRYPLHRHGRARSPGLSRKLSCHPHVVVMLMLGWLRAVQGPAIHQLVELVEQDSALIGSPTR